MRNEIIGFSIDYYEEEGRRHYFVVTLWEPMLDLFPDDHFQVVPTVDGFVFPSAQLAKDWAQEIYLNEDQHVLSLNYND